MALAAASGTLLNPGGGWAAEVGLYLFNTLIFGALTINIWEETAWAGFAQSRLMARHGLLVGSLLPPCSSPRSTSHCSSRGIGRGRRWRSAGR